MSDNNKSYRVKANIGEDKVLNVNLNQDYNVLELLSLKIGTENLYKLHTSEYGCVAGRVLANGNFGIPNAKISIFIAVSDEDSEDAVLSYLYPYRTVNSKNADSIRYNLLSEEQLSDCHRNVGTFPSKRMVLDDNNTLEIYDKYYKFTTRSNEAGDYMIFGVPTGNQTLHVDIDLSDIGILSQRPRDMVYKGYNITQFENGNMFKKSTELDNLAQIVTQNQSLYVYPFWGDDSTEQIAITRRDINIQYEFTPTCVFIGSIVTDEQSSGISKRCIPTERMGKMDKLTTGNGTIEMIRKKPDGTVEEVTIQGNALIDGNGVWCYQIPMNLDYVRTDEYGNVVPTDDPTKGIPTRAKVRFRFSLTEFENTGGRSHISKVLVPNNPKFSTVKARGDAEGAVLDYVFGTYTDEESFKDLFWNDVYTVKSFIPRFQMLNIDRNRRFSGIKAVNVNNDNNPIPYNNIRVDLTFMFTLQCAVFKVLIWVVSTYNKFLNMLYSFGHTWVGQRVWANLRKKIRQEGRCIYLGEGYCPQMEGWYFAPNCNNNDLLRNSFDWIKQDSEYDPESVDYQNKDNLENGNRFCLTNQIKYFVQCVEIGLAMEYNAIQFDFYNDWVNGMLYVPRWFADMRPKRSYMFGAIKVRPRINACMQGNYNASFKRRYVQQCALSYSLPNGTATDYTKVTTALGCKNNSKQKCHKSKGREWVEILANDGGVVHEEQTLQDKYAYYFRPCEWLPNGKKCNLFATDIVLIGSLDENNSQGIPQTFTKLSSSSYQLPDTLASTNLGAEGFVYGSGDGNALCNGTNKTGAEQLPPSFDSVKEWTKGKDFYEAAPYDEKEYEVTESAGIDWGFHGPNQGENNLSKLYFPGGHFLGISCMNAQTNIKSCINLSRICEVGSMISQRQSLIMKNGDNGYKYSYLIPTGLISGESINDYGFKNEFASLNHNGLRTRRNPETQLLEYDFETIHPINFNGDLAAIVSENTEYNNINGKPDNPNGRSGATAYVRTIEESSKDYYRFRLGLSSTHTAKDAAEKYLKTKGSSVALPVYENSFYFYFGLKNGSTALDRFYKEFYAECPQMKTYEPSYEVSVIQNCDFCDREGQGGQVEIRVKNVDNPKYRYSTGNTPTGEFVPFSTYPEIISGIVGNTTLTIEIVGDNVEMVTKTITVPFNYPESIQNIDYEVVNYTEELSPFTESGSCGNIVFSYDSFTDENFVGIVIYTPNLKTSQEKPYAKIIWNENTSYSGSTDFITSAYSAITEETLSSLTNVRVDAWKGNEEYAINILYSCDGDTLYQLPIREEYIEMPAALDVIFDGYEYASYRYLVAPIEERFGTARAWYDLLLNENENVITYLKTRYPFSDDVTRLYTAIYHVKKAIYYQSSVSSTATATGSLRIEAAYGVPPYDFSESKGLGEQMVDYGEYEKLQITNSTVTASEAEASGYTMDPLAFVSPTINKPLKIGYYYDYDGTKWKPLEYTITVKDSADESAQISFLVPSVYLPFFFRSVEAVDFDNRRTSLRIAIANPLCEGDYDEGELWRDVAWNFLGHPIERYIHLNKKDYRRIGTGMDDCQEKEYPTYTASSENQNFMVTDGNHGVEVKEDGSEAITYTENVHVNFLGDETITYADIRRVYYIWWNDERAEIINSLPYMTSGDTTTFIPYDVGDSFISISPLMMYYYANAVFGDKSLVIPTEDIINNDLHEPEIYYFQTTHVYAIYSSAYVEPTNEPSESEIKNNSDFYPFGIRHTNEVYIIRKYDKQKFKDLVRNTFGNNS